MPRWIATVLFISVGFIGATYFRSQTGAPLSIRVPTPTPIPYAEITIPSLRSRTYTSRLQVLEKIADYETYSSFRSTYDSDGLAIYGMITIPKDPDVSYPAIVFVHGYIPPTIYKTQERYLAHTDALARNGFVVFKIDLRGHDESQGTPTGAYYSSDYVIDTLNARAALETADFVQKKNIGLWGHSMAGNVVMRAFAARPTIPAVVIWAGAGYTYTDLLTYRISDASYRPLVSTPSGTPSTSQRVRAMYGQFNPSHPFWKQVAVTDYLADIQGALELHHAVDDSVVSIEYSRNLLRLLDKTNVAHELYEYQTGGHNMTDPSFTLAMRRTVEFFQRYLQ